MKVYAGVGSRDTPRDVYELMVQLAMALATKGWVLRTGGAPGADTAFLEGAIQGGGRSEVYLPWAGSKSRPFCSLVHHPKFVGSVREVRDYDEPELWKWVQKYHPNPSALKTQGARKLMMRNTWQVMGSNLKTPCQMVVCWTRDGKASGGTGQALRIAQDQGIEIRNLYYEEVRESATKFINSQE